MHSENEACATKTHATNQPLGNLFEVQRSQSGSNQGLSGKDREEYIGAETLKHKITSLFLCMQTVLHISKSAL